MFGKVINAIHAHLTRCVDADLEQTDVPYEDAKIRQPKKAYLFCMAWLMFGLMWLDGLRWVRRGGWREVTDIDRDEFGLPKKQQKEL